jgi:hypothetical protein
MRLDLYFGSVAVNLLSFWHWTTMV